MTSRAAKGLTSGHNRAIAVLDPDPDPGRLQSGEEIEYLTSDILRGWRQRLRRRPNDEARSGDRGESERLLVAALLRASNSGDDALLPGLAAAAAQYGAAQRRERLDPGALCDELSLLRQIVWVELKSLDPTLQKAAARILRFDRAVSIVVKAALAAGYSGVAPTSEPPCSEGPSVRRPLGERAEPNER